MIKELEQMGIAWIVLIREQLKLFTLEAKLAKISLLPALVCTCLLLFLSISTWLCALTLAGYGLYFYSQSLFITFLTVFLVNLGMMLTAALLLKRYLKRMSFQYTRAQFHEYQKLEQTD